MKMSLCQMIAIGCIFAVGFMTVTPFIQMAAADAYTVPHYDVTYYTCESCGLAFWASVFQSGTTTIYHGSSLEHDTSATYDRTVVPCGYCDTCEAGSYY